MSNPTDGMGIYESVHPTSTPQCYNRLSQIAAGGFKLAVNYAIPLAHMGTLSDNQNGTIFAYLNYAQSVGLKIIFNLSDPSIWLNNTVSSTYSQLWTDAGSPTGTMTHIDQVFTQYIINQVKTHPAIWGWYVGDEVTDPTNHAALLTHVGYIQSADTGHPTLYIASGTNTTSFGLGVSTFSDIASVVGDDFYQLGVTSARLLTPVQEASGIQSYANAHSLQSAAVLQAFSTQQFYPASVSQFYPRDAPYPSAQWMRWMRDTFLANMSPRVLLWFAYYATVTSDNPVQRWGDLCWAANGSGSAPNAYIASTQDNFARANQSGWGVGVNGDSWTQRVGSYTLAISGVTGTATGSTGAAQITLSSRKASVSQYIAYFGLSSPATDAAGLIIHWTSTSNYVYAQVLNTTLSVIEVISGVPTTLGSATITAMTPSLSRCYLKIYDNGSTYSVFFWDHLNGSEPTTATLTCPSAMLPSGQGISGVFVNLASTANVASFYNFSSLTTPSTTLYVSVTGNDDNTGTQTSPLATLERASYLALSGVTGAIHVLPGTITRTTTIQTAAMGTGLVPIQIISDTLLQAIIRSSGASAIWTDYGQYVTISGFDIGATDATAISGLTQNGNGCTIQNCIVHDITSNPVNGIIGVGHTNINVTDSNVLNCTIYNIGNGTSNFNHSGIRSSSLRGYIQNNICYAQWGFAIMLYPTGSNLTVSNNLIFNCLYCIHVTSSGITNDYTTVSNNLIANNPSVDAALYENGVTGPHNQYLNNLIWNSGPTPYYNLENGLVPSGTVLADPQFINYQANGSGDYQVQTTSPAINAGTSTGAATTDFFGLLRSVKPTMDIGPYCYVRFALFPTISRRTGQFPTIKRRESW